MNLRQIATATIALSSLIVSQSAPLFAQSAQQQGFHVEFPHLHDPFKTYTPVNVPAPNLANSVRLDQCIHDGKLYLSIDDAIDLALENNLDIAVRAITCPSPTWMFCARQRAAFALGVPGIVQITLGRRQCVKRRLVGKS